MDEVWETWVSIPLCLVISVVADVLINLKIKSSFSYMVEEGINSYYKTSVLGIKIIVAIVICFCIINVINVGIVLKNNVIPKANRRKMGNLIYINAPTKKIYYETIRKFGNEYKVYMCHSFDVIFVPYRRKIDFEKTNITKLLKRKNCVLFINVDINTDIDKDCVLYDMRIRAEIDLKTKYPKGEELTHIFFSNILKKFKNTVFTSGEMIRKLRGTASEMSLAFTCLIGFSLFLNGQLSVAEQILESVESSDEDISFRDQIVKFSRLIRQYIYMTWAQMNAAKYIKQCNDEIALDKMNEMIEKAHDCGDESTDYYCNKAYYYIAKSGNVEKAKECIEKCKLIKGEPQVWKYSEAFFKAYENRAIASIYSSYEKALKIDYNIQDIIMYIEMVLNREPDKSGLHLALGILYNKLGDSSLSKNNLNKYLDMSPNSEGARAFLKAKLLL